MIGNFLALPYMVMGNPTGHGIQFEGMGILFNYLCQRSALVLQSFRPNRNTTQVRTLGQANCIIVSRLIS